MSGIYTRQTQLSFGELIWHKDNESKATYKMGATQCQKTYYWGISKCSFTSSGGSCSVASRAWGANGSKKFAVKLYNLRH